MTPSDSFNQTSTGPPREGAPRATGTRRRLLLTCETHRQFRILVVDDCASIAQLLATMLELLGHKVRYATDASAALELFTTFHPEVVLSDLEMDGIDGYELASRIRASDANREIVLIAHSGFTESKHRHRAAAVGFDFFIGKPIEPATLRPLFSHIASRHSSN